MTGATETAQLLARRYGFLRELADGPRTKRELAAALEVSRSTVDRAVRELEAAGFAARSNGRVTVTPTGSIAYASCRTHLAELEGITTAEPALSALRGTTDLPPALFRGADVVTPNRVAPQHPHDRLVDVLEEAEVLRHYATGIRPEYEEPYWGRLEEGRPIDVVAVTAVLEKFIEAYRAEMASGLDTDDFSIQETAEKRPYSMVIGDTDAVCVLIYEGHSLAAIVYNDAPAAVMWALEQFESLRADADPVPGTRA